MLFIFLIIIFHTPYHTKRYERPHEEEAGPEEEREEIDKSSRKLLKTTPSIILLLVVVRANSSIVMIIILARNYSETYMYNHVTTAVYNPVLLQLLSYYNF